MLGVIPVHLLGRERVERDRSGMVITEDMHERKKVMFMNSDAAVVLPGGAGSLDEFFEVLTWAQIGLHSRPILLLDVAGYWQPLLAQSPAAATVYENLHYAEAGLCHAPLDQAVAAEVAAREAIEAARRKPAPGPDAAAA